MIFRRLCKRLMRFNVELSWLPTNYT